MLTFYCFINHRDSDEEEESISSEDERPEWNPPKIRGARPPHPLTVTHVNQTSDLQVFTMFTKYSLQQCQVFLVSKYIKLKVHFQINFLSLSILHMLTVFLKR